jgi:hypothetical protein
MGKTVEGDAVSDYLGQAVALRVGQPHPQVSSTTIIFWKPAIIRRKEFLFDLGLLPPIVVVTHRP